MISKEPAHRESKPPLERVVINFADRCNMSCRYCYVPFSGVRVDFAILTAVLTRCSELGFKVVTFGGGDPFIYPQFRSVLRTTSNLGLEIHVDTNAIGLRAGDIAILEETTSLLSVPLDGSTAKIHNKMRNSTDHFQRVLYAMKLLTKTSLRWKVNTMVGRPNLHDVGEIQRLLLRFAVSIWSVYQFMPLHDASGHEERFAIAKKEFLDATSHLEERSFAIELGTADSRRDSYVFVTPHGTVYTHNAMNDHEYAVLGRVFDNEWLDKYENATTIRPAARKRYTAVPRDRKNDLFPRESPS